MLKINAIFDKTLDAASFAKTAHSLLSEILGSNSTAIQEAVNHTKNVFGVLKADSSDGTEGLVFMAPYRTLSGSVNKCGVAYLIAASRQYRKYNFWARDFVILIPGVGDTNQQKPVNVAESLDDWLAAYHGVSHRGSFPLNGGVLQAGLSIELESDRCDVNFGEAELYIEGPGGLLPNLDLVNVLVMIEKHRVGKLILFPKDSLWYRIYERIPQEYARSLFHVFLMLSRQAFGYPIYSHGPLLKYRIDAVTLAMRQIPSENSSEFSDRNLFE